MSSSNQVLTHIYNSDPLTEMPPARTLYVDAGVCRSPDERFPTRLRNDKPQVLPVRLRGLVPSQATWPGGQLSGIAELPIICFVSYLPLEA
jgi:hypothetical protein